MNEESFDLSKIKIEDIKDYLIDNLSVEELKEYNSDIIEELECRVYKNKRLNKLKKEIQRQRILFRKQLKEEQDEELKILKKVRREYIDSEELEVPKKKKK